jgi:hypothetical protein
MTTTTTTGTGTAAARLRAWALSAIERHAAEGTLPTSLRHLFYEAVMAEVIAKGAVAGAGGRRADQNLTEAVTWLREHGEVPWDVIEDRTRRVHDYRGHGATILDGVDNMLDSITIDPWDDVLPVLVAESESVAGVLLRVADALRVPIVPTRGQANGWLRTTVARQLAGRPIVVGYLGDADKAGGDIEANTRRVLDEVLDIKHWERLALTWDQVESFGLPTLPRTDGRSGVTHEVCELETLPQRVLTDEVEAFLAGWLPDGVDLDDVHEREDEQRAAIRRELGIGGAS